MSKRSKTDKQIAKEKKFRRAVGLIFTMPDKLYVLTTRGESGPYLVNSVSMWGKPLEGSFFEFKHGTLRLAFEPPAYEIVVYLADKSCDVYL